MFHNRIVDCVLLTAVLAVPALAAAPLVKTVPASATNAGAAHVAFSRQSTTLKGTSGAEGQNIQARWDFGDGSDPAVSTVSNRFDVSATHVYAGLPGTSYTATLTITDLNTNETASAPYLVKVSEKTLQSQVDAAVDEALWYLHKSMARNSLGVYDGGGWRGSCYVCDDTGAADAANLLAFEASGFLASGDPANPYTETVARGLNTMFDESSTASLRNSDWLAAIAAANTPDARAVTGPSDIAGQTYQQIVEGAVASAATSDLKTSARGVQAGDAQMLLSMVRANRTVRTSATDQLLPQSARMLVDRQNAAGYWTGHNPDGLAALETAQSVLILRPAFTSQQGPSQITNISSQVRVTGSGYLYNRVTRRFNGTLTITNTSASVLSGPFDVVLTNLAAGVSLANSAGAYNGDPYVVVSGTTTMNPGDTATVAVSFTNSGNGLITFTAVTYSGTFPPAAVSVSCPVPTGTNGTGYSSALAAGGGILPYAYSITGNLPGGLSLNPATGAITGNPNANGPFNFTANVSDGSGVPSGNASTSCTITISPPASPLTLSCPAPAAQMGTPYSSSLVAGGGTPSYTYSIQSGSLPTPLTLNSATGAISGTPNAQGPQNFVASVTDSTSGTALTQTASCSITVSPASTVPVTFQTSPAGQSFTVDGTTYTSTQVLNWTPGSTHSFSTTSPQGSGGTRFVFNNWSNGGAISQTGVVTPGSPTTYTASFDTQYQLTTSASPANGGTVTPATGSFFAAGSTQNLSAVANSGFVFANWTGPVTSANSAATTVVLNGPVTVTANFTATSGITVQTAPAGLSFTVDGTTYTTAQSFNWTVGSSHTISTTTPQTTGGTRNVFNNWSDGGAISHSVTAPATATSYTASFDTQYQLNTAAAPSSGGTVTPATGSFFPAGSVQNLTATPNANFVFTSWTGPVANSNSASTTVTLNGPVSVTANFSATSAVTVQTAPAGLSFSVDGTTYTSAQSFNWIVGSSHSVVTTTPQGSGGTRYVFNNWSDGGAISHTITGPATAATYTASFDTQYQLTTVASPSNGGTITPATGSYFAAGSVQNLTATPNANFVFTSWTGPVANASSASTTVTLNGPVTVTATFTPTVAITVGALPAGAGITFTVDGTTYSSQQSFNWIVGSSHTLATTTPQGSAGTQYGFSSWSDAGAISHTVTGPSVATAYTANFTTQYQLTTAASPANGGTVTPATGSYFASGSTQTVTASPASGFAFNGWTGPVASATSASTTVTLNGPVSVTANFVTALAISCPATVSDFIGNPYSSSLTGSGGTSSYTYSILSGSLPTSLTLNSASGLISGTPTVKGTFNFVGKVVDSTSPIQQSATAACSITVPNRAPAATSQSVTTNEDTAKMITLAGTDPDGDHLTFSVVASPSHGTLGAISAASCSGTPSSCTATVTYTPSANYNGSDSFTFKTNDGTVDSASNGTVTITINPVNDPPVAAAHSYSVQANMMISVPAASGLLVGATDPDSGDANFTEVYTVGSVSATSPAGGAVTYVASTGAFTFEPPSGYTGNMSFTYTVCDNGNPLPSLCSSPATVSLTISGPVIYFVNPAAGSNGTGTLSSPFNSLASANTALGLNTNQRIFVYSGTTAAGVGSSLGASDWLVGQGVTGTSFDAVMGITPPSTTIARPAINGTAPVIQGTVDMNGSSSEVLGLTIHPSGGVAGLRATSGNTITGLAVSDVPLIQTSGARAVDLQNASGTFTIGKVTAASPDIGINLVNLNPASGSFTVAGTGGNCSLADTTCSGGSITSATTNSININNSKSISFSHMHLNHSTHSSLNGNVVTGLTVDTSVIDGANGTDTSAEGSLIVTDWLGTGSITSSDISGAIGNNVQVQNTQGTLNRLTITNSKIHDNDPNQANHGLRFATVTTPSGGSGVVMNLTVTGSTFSHHRSDHLDTDAQGFSHMDIVFSNNTLVGGESTTLADGVVVSDSDSSNVTVDFNGNSINGAKLSAFEFFQSGTSAAAASLVGKFRNNTIGTTGVSGSGSLQGNGLLINPIGLGTMTLNVTGNTVRQYGQIGIDIIAGQTGPHLNLTLTGNTVKEPASTVNSLQGIALNAGQLTNDNPVVCADISGNDAVGSGNATNGLTDFRLRQRFASTVQLPGYTGAGGDTTAVANYILGRNTAGATANASTSFPTGSFANGGAACTQAP